MRYVFYKYGTEEAKRLYLEEFEELKKDGSIDFEAPALPLEHHKPSFSPLDAPTDLKPGSAVTPTSRPMSRA